ncbi:Beta-ketoadipate enol-lactone hydrolase [Labilithrix luteola]|uniref:Beta-ketoadipate enol-lactone hydrolase n=1 Tax=Labilithrix luteola TaxID=1391654 RepID=A0A0K1PNV2_9BACT|nr:alpha/beta hydrolase [Labilithrix luteola]AKU95091.1 Beta-ketoadipate enol-lactone hydrolase [Labilithrix luteola]
METIEVDGGALSAMSMGTGRPVLFLHGLMTGSMATWYAPFALPLSKTRRAVIYDLRGHGGSSTPASGYGVVQQCEDLDTVRRRYAGATDDDRIDLVGHSAGAVIALCYALAKRALVRRLVLVDPPIIPSERVPSDWVEAGVRGTLHAHARLLDASPDTGAPRGAPPGRREARMRERVQRLLHETTLVADLADTRFPDVQTLASFDVPVLIVTGKRSEWHASSVRLAQLLPVARLVEFDCGHYVPDEQPVALRSEIETFLSTPEIAT